MLKQKFAFIPLILIICSFFLGIGIAADTIINETLTVQNGAARWWTITLYSGDRITGSLSVGGGDINFYILDGANLANYNAGQSFYVQYSRQGVIQLPSVDYTIPYDGTWAILLDNKYSTYNSKIVSINMSVENGYGSSGNIMIMMFFGLLAMGAIGLIIHEYQKKKNPLTSQY